MKSYVALFLVSGVVSALLTPVMRALAFRLGAVSHPGGRNVNARAIPRFGGIAICVAFFVALGALYLSSAGAAVAIHSEALRLVGLVVGSVGLCVVGVIDDARRVRALYKLYAQLFAALIAFKCGFRIDAVMLPLVGPLSMGVFALPVTVFWIVGITNAINLIDGLDGLAGGVVVFAATTNLVVAHVTGATFVAIVMVAVLGSVVGFLLFNFNPARIFMGDSGSYFLGFLLGTMSLAGAAQKASTTVSLLVPVLALGLPIVDTSFAMLRRFLERRPLFSPDRGHIHHRLLDLGLTHRRAVLTLYGICLLLAVTAIGVSLGRIWTVGVAILTGTVLVIGVTRFVGHYEYALSRSRQKTRLRSREVELLRSVLPDVSAMFAGAQSEDDIWGVLKTIVERGQLASFDVVRSGGSDAEITSATPAKASEPAPETVSARYPVGPDAFARSELRFRWRSESGEVSPQAEVLLQVLVDVVARALTRVESPLAPLPPQTTQETSDGARAEKGVSYG